MTRDAGDGLVAQRAVPVLLCRVGRILAALPMDHVVETMRPLAVEPLAGMPPCVWGLAVVRGRPVPVIDAAIALGCGVGAAPTRFITLMAGPQPFSLAVEEVIGVRRLTETLLQGWPTLLTGVAADLVVAIGRLDDGVVALLQTARLVPEAVWPALVAARGANDRSP